MVIKFQSAPSLTRSQLFLKGFRLALSLFLLAILLGVGVAGRIGPTPALILGAATATIWACSSFDPRPRSWLGWVWQYVIPWVIGLAGLLCFPMGFLLGLLTGSRWIGIVAGVGLGSLISAALIASIVAMYDLLLLTVYQTQIFGDRITTSQANHVQQLQKIEQYQQRQTHLSHTIALSTWSFVWSILQGVAIANTLVLGSFWGGAAGLLAALIWNMGVVTALIKLHHKFRRRLRRGQRFLLILSSLGAGVAVGSLLLS